MKRGKKLLINVSVIAIILLGIYYFGGFYISKEECIVETIRGLNGNEGDTIMEFESGNKIFTLVADMEEKTFSIVGTKKIGFLYHTASSSVGNKIDEEKCIDVSGLGGSEIGMVVAVYRNDKNVAKVEVNLENGSSYTLDEWKSDFVGLRIEGDDWHTGTYKAYDASNQLIEEVYY